MKASIVGAVLACSLLFAPLAHADTNYVPIGDPYTDTLQLWSGIVTAFSSLANDVTALFSAHQFAAAKAPNYHHAPKQLPTAMAASAALGLASLPVSTTLATNEESDATATGSPQSRSPPTAGPSSVIYRVVQAPAFDASAFVTRNQFNAAMAALGSSVQQLLAVSQSNPLPQNVAADGNAAIPYAAENNITNLSGVTITNANLTASEIPDLSGSYLSLSGGAVSGTASFADDVGIGTTSPSDVLAVNGPIFLANVSPAATSNRLYSNGGALYWNGSLLGGASVGNWATDGTNVWRAGGNVGIGTTSPGSALSVAGNGYFTGGLAVSGNTTLSNATSSTFFSTIGNFTTGVITTLSGTTLTYTAASTTNLTVSGNATLGNATSTNFFSTTASSTNLYAQTASLGTLSLAGTLSAQGGGTLSGTFSGTPIFNSGFISQASSTFSSTLNANTLNLINPLGVASGGTGANSFGQGWIFSNGGSGALAASSSPTVNYLTATSTTATSTFAGNLSVGGNLNFNGSFLQNGSPFVGSQWTTSGSNISYTSGNVGIGTTSPSGKLTVDAPSAVVNSVQSAGALNLLSSTAYGVDIGPQLRFSGENGSGNPATTPYAFATIAGRKENATAGNLAGYLQFSTTQSNSTISEAMRITSTGNVGIGTTSPAATLSVSGNGYLTGGLGVGVENTTADTIQSSGNILGGGTLALSGTSGTSTIASGQGFTIGASQFVVQQGSGNVGIGTTAPESPLQINESGSANIHFTNSATGLGIGTGAFFGITPAGAMQFFSYNNEPMSFGTNGNFYMTILGSGNVGIGTTSPFDLLSVAGNQYNSGYYNTSGTSGGYEIDNNLILQASSTYSSLFLGQGAGNNSYTGTYNFGLGPLALNALTSGQYNTAFGYNSLHTLTTGTGNVGIGQNTLGANNASYDIAIGYAALQTNTSGTDNNAVGYEALLNNSTGADNDAFGYEALQHDTVDDTLKCNR